MISTAEVIDRLRARALAGDSSFAVATVTALELEQVVATLDRLLDRLPRAVAALELAGEPDLAAAFRVVALDLGARCERCLDSRQLPHPLIPGLVVACPECELRALTDARFGRPAA